MVKQANIAEPSITAGSAKPQFWQAFVMNIPSKPVSPAPPLRLLGVLIPAKGPQFFSVSAHFTNLFWFNQAQPLRNLILKACLQA
jgi:hypothetical protein